MRGQLPSLCLLVYVSLSAGSTGYDGSNHANLNAFVQSSSSNATQQSPSLSPKEAALADLHRSLQRTPRPAVALPYSNQFLASFHQLRESGLCSSWMQVERDTQSGDITYSEIEEAVRERRDEEEEDIEDILGGEGESFGATDILLSLFTHPLSLTCIILSFSLFTIYLVFLSPQICASSFYRRICCCMQVKRRQFSWIFLLLSLIVVSVLAAACIYLFLHANVYIQRAIGGVASSACAVSNSLRTAEWGVPLTGRDSQGDSYMRADSNTHEMTYEEEKVAISGGDSKGDSRGLEEYASNTFLVPGLFEDRGEQEGDSIDYPIGVRGYRRNLDALTSLLSNDRTEGRNLVSIILGYLDRDMDVRETLDLISEKNDGFKYNMGKFEEIVRKYKMRSLFVEAVRGRGETDYFRSLHDAVDSYKSEIIENVGHGVDLPSVEDIKGLLNMKEIEEEISNIHKTAGNSLETGRFAGIIASLSLWVETALLYLFILFCVISIILFFISKGRSGRVFTCVSWYCLFIAITLSLLITAAVFLSSYIGKPVCTAGSSLLWSDKASDNSNVLVEEEKIAMSRQLEAETHKDGDGEDLILQCIQKDNHPLVDSSAYTNKLQLAQRKLQQAEELILRHIPKQSTNPVFETMELIQDWSNEFGNYVVFDETLLQSNEETRDLLNTFPEVLSSGIHSSTRQVKYNGKTVTIYGLRDVNKFIYPASIEGYAPIEATLTVTADSPSADDDSFVAWLNDQETKKVQEYTSEGQSHEEAQRNAAEYVKKLKNAILLCKMKLRLLRERVECYKYGRSEEIYHSTCSIKEFFGDMPVGDWTVVEQSAYYIRRSAVSLRQAISSFANQSEDYIREIVHLVSQFLSNLPRAANCSFVRKDMMEAAYLGCTKGVDYAWSGGILRLSALLMSVALAFIIFIIWRLQQDNKIVSSAVDTAEKEEEDKLLSKKEGDSKETEEEFADASTERDRGEDREAPIEDSSSMWA